MSSPISRALLVLSLAVAAAAAAADDPCWECRAQACIWSFDRSTDEAWGDYDAGEIATWNEIRSRIDDLEAANAEHDAALTRLAAERDARIEEAYMALVACLEP